ncbi:hypothetical protein BV22DRAFT_459310 [Leucogyrophana mollusca]|uniref:Uncharacterized protein n=1 Tax=Leucogyrophana mollusca TaxID=85980 RepID=A0ACB8BIR8_9AGAM|nr:hypothetical protein BV22DRAFT_459310 [Leucogyrophana mollusca]
MKLFEPEYFKSPTCLCGKPTIADHDLCYCSPACAQEDAARSLFNNQSHYREICKIAKEAAEPSNDKQLPPGAAVTTPAKPTARAITAARTTKKQGSGWPTLADITTEILTRRANASAGEGLSSIPPQAKLSVHNPDERGPVLSPTDLINLTTADGTPRHFLKRSLRSTVDLGRSIRRSASVHMLKRLKGTEPLRVEKKIGKWEEVVPEELSQPVVEQEVLNDVVNAPIIVIPRSPITPVEPPAERPSCLPSRFVRRSISLAALDDLEDPLWDDGDFSQVLRSMREDSEYLEIDPSSFFADEEEEWE